MIVLLVAADPRQRQPTRLMLWAVSGGAGFLGLHLARRLLADGHEVRTLDVVPLDDAELERVGRRSCAATSAIRERVRELVAGCGRRRARGCGAADPGVARVDPLGERRPGPSTSCSEARDAGVRPRRVHLVDRGLRRARRSIRSRKTTRSSASAGTASRRSTRKRCAASPAVETTIVRPKTFIGPERLGVFEILFDWIREGRRIYILGKGHNRYQLLAVEDLVDAIVRAATVPEAARDDVQRRRDGVRHGPQRPAGADRPRRLRRRGSRPVPVKPAELALRTLELMRVSPLAEWHYKTAHKDSFVDISRAQRGARLAAQAVEQGGADRDVRLVPRKPRARRRRRRDASRPLEPAGARPAEAAVVIILSQRGGARSCSTSTRSSTPSPTRTAS